MRPSRGPARSLRGLQGTWGHQKEREVGKYPSAQTSLRAGCYSQERPNWIASVSANSRSSLGQERSSRAGPSCTALCGEGRVCGSLLVRQGVQVGRVHGSEGNIITNTVSSPKGQFWLLPEGGAAGKPDRASGVSRAGPWCPLGVSVCPPVCGPCLAGGYHWQNRNC